LVLLCIVMAGCGTDRIDPAAESAKDASTLSAEADPPVVQDHLLSALLDSLREEAAAPGAIVALARGSGPVRVAASGLAGFDDAIDRFLPSCPRASEITIRLLRYATGSSAGIATCTGPGRPGMA
jgi:hypothetical protein